MSPRIRILDPLVANQIAAGEVVERPSSVVKELVENALDAGATAVEIELDDGGRGRIEIIDNGGGIEPEDAPLVFARHATSKLQSAQELAAIASYGFRGEALASIASVGRVLLHSRRPDAELGVEVSIEGSAAPAVRPIHCGVGTRIVVRDLFFNTPARAAFLRGAATELGHVIRLVEALACARPELSLSLRANNRKVVSYPARATLQERALDVFGPEVAADLYAIALDGPYRLRGLLSSPAVNRGTPASLFLVVDGRPVRDRTLGHSVVAAYGELMERGRHPVGVLHLDVPPGAVDVNVHPTKAEVRFASSRAVHAAVGEAVRTMLSDAPWAAPTQPAAPFAASQLSLGVATRTARPRPSFVSPELQRSQPTPLHLSPAPVRTAPPMARAASVSRPASMSVVDSRPAAVAAPQGLPPLAVVAEPAWPTAAASAAGETTRERRFLGQIAGRWLAFAVHDGLMMLDAHAAHERQLLGRLLAGRAAGNLDCHRLLIPRIVPLPPDQLRALLAAEALWRPFGLDFGPAGEQALLLRSHPVDVPLGRIEGAVQALASALLAREGRHSVPDEPADLASSRPANLRSDLASDSASTRWVAETLACHGAVRRGEEVGPAFVEALLAGTAGVDLRRPGLHGAPARLDLPATALERLFVDAGMGLGADDLAQAAAPRGPAA